MKLKILFAMLAAGASLSLNAAEKEKLPGPLFDGLGNYHHPVTAKSKNAPQRRKQRRRRS